MIRNKFFSMTGLNEKEKNSFTKKYYAKKKFRNLFDK